MVTIDVSPEVWKRLLMEKEPGDSFDDVLRRELGLPGEDGESESEHDSETSDGAMRYETYQAVLERWQPGRDQNERERIREQAIEAAEWLRDQDREIRKNEFIDALYDDEIDVQADTWWRNRARAGLQQLRDEGLVEKDGRKWRWVG